MAISARASQIFYLIQDVFAEQIQEFNSSDRQDSFWESQFI